MQKWSKATRFDSLNLLHLVVCKNVPGYKEELYKNWNWLQIVTQTLHIPPTARPVVHGLDLENQSGETDGGCDSTNEATKLRRDMRKLKEYLKTSVQVM